MSGYRDAFDTCPTCGTTLVSSGAVRRCDGCRGVWIPEPVLAEMLLRMNGNRELDVPRYTAAVAASQLRACPTCRTPMSHVLLEEVPVDRCGRGHGVWLDDGELQRSLFLHADRQP